MKMAYFDCFSGIAGDMVLGALVDAGMPLAHLRHELKKISLAGYTLERKRQRGSTRIKGTNIHVRVRQEPRDTRYRTIARLIDRSRLKARVKEISLAIMERLARAEARVHNVSLSRVHFHEVGAVDSIVDCVGAAIGFDFFDFDDIASSPLPVTRGRIRCQHGWLPVPAPATLNILKGVPLERAPVRDEIVTPTGAAIIATAATHFGECPLQRIDQVGYGYGDKTFPDIPNALRIMIGSGFTAVTIEATVDDMNPQIFDYVMERLFSVGAVDVTLQPVQMKKNRPGTVISCQAPWHLKDTVMEVLLRETTSTGVRYYPIERRMLVREMTTLTTKFGRVRIKVARDNELGIIKHIPEYEDMKRIAKKVKLPLIDVYRAVLKKIS